MSRILVDQVRSNSASSDALTLDGSGNVTVPGNITLSGNATLSGTATGFPKGRAHNLIINGAFQIAQRAQSNNNHGYGSVDRFAVYNNGTDEAPTHAQVDVASGTTPYTLGFRKALRVTNGNQTSGAGAGDHTMIQTKQESQDIAQSGWNYTSASSYVTLSFWVKSSVSQNFYGYFRTKDGTEQIYPFETGTLSANTWTKVTKTIPGNSNLQFDNDANQGTEINISPFMGTDFTDSSVSLNTWGAYSGSTRTPDYTSTWYTTNDATFEITGVLLEVGDSGSDYPHRSFGEELALCQRYYYIQASSKHNSSGEYEIEFISANMRATPTATRLSGVYFGGESSTSFSSIQTLTNGQSSEVVTMVYVIVNSSDANCGGKYAFDAEL